MDNKEPVSRRDFLRRAGKEAVSTGVSLVPGGNLVKKVLTSDVPEEADAEAVADDWKTKLATWLKKRRQPE